MRGRNLRRLAVLAASSVALLAAVLLLLHLSVVRSRVFDRAVAELSTRFGLDLQADAFSYNLLTRRVTLRGARLAASAHADQPFFAADRVEVRLPLSVFAGHFALSSVAVSGGQLTFVRGADGELNLPPSTGPDEPPGATPARLDLRGVEIAGLDFSYRDPAAGVSVEARDIRTDLEYHLIRVFEGVSGAFGIDGGVTVTVDGRTLRAAPIDARLAFDGSDVSLQDVTLRTDEATLAVKGRVLRVLDDPRFDLSVEGTADLARALEWAPELPVAVSGPVAIEGTVTGAVGAFVLAADVRSSGIAAGAEGGLSIDGDVRLTPDVVSSEGVTVSPAGGGTIDVTFTQPFADDESAEYSARWSGLDPGVLYRVSGTEPGPIGARIEGTADIVLSPDSRIASATITNRATAAPGPGLVPVAGTLDARVSDGRWRAEHRHRSGGTSVSGVVEGAFDAGEPLASTLGGRVDAEVGDLRELARLTAAFGLPLPGVVADGHGPLSASATLAGRLDDPRVSAKVTGSGLALDAVGDDIRIDAGVEASRHAVDVPALSLDVGRARLRGDVHVDLDRDTLGGTVRIDAPAAADFQAALPEGYRLEGPLQATARLGGSPAAPAIDITVTGAGLSFADQPIDELSARARVEGTRVELTALRLTEGGGALTGTAAYDWDSGRYQADLDGHALTWDGIVLEGETTRVTVDVAFTGAGTIDDPRGEGTVAFELVGGTFEDLVQRGVAKVTLEGPVARVSGDIPQLGAAITGTVGTSAPYRYDLSATLDGLALEPAATLGGIREGEVTGTLSLTASATGTAEDTADAAVHVDLQRVDALVGGLPVLLTSPATIDWTPETTTVEQLDLSVGEGRLSASGVIGADTGRPLTATFEGDLAELARMGRALGAPGALDLDGHLAAHWESTTGIESASATLRVTDGRVSWVNAPPVEDLAIDATFDGAALAVTTLTGRWQDGGIEGTATIPRALITGGGTGTSADAGQAHLRVTGLTEAALAPWVDEQTRRRISGHVSATLDADIRGTTLESIDARVTFDEASFTLAGVDATPVRPARLSLADGVITLDDAAWNVGRRPIAFSGTVDLAADGAPALDLAASGTADLRVLAAFLPDTTTGGSADLDVRVGGTTEAPAVDGRITLNDAELAIRDPRFAITGLSGPITLDGNRVGFGGLSGTANGGSIRFDGALTMDGGVPTGGQLITELRRVALEYPEGLRSEADGLLTLAPEGEGGGWLLTGDVRIERSSYRENLSLAALATANRTETRTVGERSALESLRLNIFVVTVQNTLIDNNYGRFEGNVAVRVVGTAANPGLTGRLSLEEGGQVYLAGNTMQIERGTISFTDPTRIQPDLDLQLTTRTGGDDITLSLSGTPDQLTVDVQNTTEPTMGDEEIYQLLLGGSGGLSGGQAAALLSSELLGSTGRAVGLDSLRVERGFGQANVRADPGQLATEADPSTRLTLSKRVRPDVEVTLSQSLRNSGDLSAIVAYRPTRNIELRGVSLGSGDRLVDIRHAITFGGGGTATVADEPDLHVSAITISGEPGESVPALKELLGLEPGERFNFFDWQRDIDRLRRHYWGAGYLEARVRATRDEDDAAGTVALDYEITEGPLATVEIVGYLAPDSLREELEDAWTRSIFDQFLLGDFELRVARHLLRDDIIGSTVKASVASETAARKVIRVDVAPGTEVSRRELRFSGNEAVQASRLESAVERAGLGAEAWLEPGTIADAVQAFYRSTGYLTATVSAGEPRVDGGVGVLPLTVVEGPRFVLGAVALEGVDAGREALVRDAAGVKAGDQYDAAGLEEGARRIERAYRSRGFNAVRVDVRSEIDEAAGTVGVTYAVQEGLQQILREVTTSGASRTREGVIAGALKLHPGDPVNLSEWGQARKRLYDTNVFRQVDIEALPLTPDADTPAGVEPVRAVVTVVEYPTWRFRYGLQLNDDRVDESDGSASRTQSLGITGDLQNQNLLGRAIGAGISGRYERDRWTARTFVQTPTFVGLPASTTLYGEVSSEDLRVDDLVQFVTDRRTIATEQRWQRGRGLQVSYGYRFERSRTFDPAPSPDDPFPLDITVDIARVNAAFLADRRNDPFNPSGGWFFSATWDQAAEALGSDYRNAKLAVQEYYFRELGPIVFASRASAGGSFWADETLLPQERFYTGGGTTVRGYGENALGPRDFLGQASGGKALLLLNQEVRFPIVWWFHGVGFVDGGNVFAENADVSLGDLKWGYGLGLRIDTPFALVRVDFGIPGSELAVGNARRANAWSSGRWYIGIGHLF